MVLFLFWLFSFLIFDGVFVPSLCTMLGAGLSVMPRPTEDPSTLGRALPSSLSLSLDPAVFSRLRIGIAFAIMDPAVDP